MRYTRFRQFGPLSVLILSLSMTSCVVESKHPLSNPDEAKPDERLFGQWKYTEKDGSGRHVFIGRPHNHEVRDLPPGIMVAYFISYTATYEIHGDRQPLCLFASSLGADNYLNVIDEPLLDPKRHPHWNKENIKSVLIVKYAISGDRLTVWEMDLQSAASVVEREQLKGEVKQGQRISNLVRG